MYSKDIGITCLILLVLILLAVSFFSGKHKPIPSYKVECIEGYSFVIGRKGNSIQIFELDHKAVTCQEK